MPMPNRPLPRPLRVRWAGWLLVAFGLMFALSGCASLERHEKLTLGCMAADVLTTAYAIETGKGKEGNPLIAWSGDAAPAVLVTFNAGLFWAMREHDVPQPWWAVIGGSRCLVAGLNLGQIAGSE